MHTQVAEELTQQLEKANSSVLRTINRRRLMARIKLAGLVSITVYVVIATFT